MSGHTPGPWSVEAGEPRQGQFISIIHYNNEPGAITMALAKVAARPTWRDEAIANARLIAAAPEYDQIARDFVACYSRGEDCHMCGGVPHSDECFVGRFLAAIAKAEGRS